MKKIRLIDSTLRDGMHAVSHQFTPEQVAKISSMLDESGVSTIEVSHGDGIGGSSMQYGFAHSSDEEYLMAASKAIKNAKLAVLLLPGIGTIEDLNIAIGCGVKTVRVATHVTEADVAEQHIAFAKKNGLEAIGFFAMSHMASPEKIAEQAKLMENYGADIVYMADSAGTMTPIEVKEKISAIKDKVSIPVGFHGHNNLGLAIGNTLAAIEAGAVSVDGCLRGLGAGAGNAQLEVLVAVLEKAGFETGVDLYKAMDAGLNAVDPLMHRPQIISNESLAIGYAGTYGSFLLHAMRAAKKFEVDARDILIEMGKRKTVGGQEDLILEVAYDLKNCL